MASIDRLVGQRSEGAGLETPSAPAAAARARPPPPTSSRGGSDCDDVGEVLEHAAIRFRIGILETPVLEQTADLLTQLHVGARPGEIGATLGVRGQLA